MIIYFSGTGNSRYAAELAGAVIGDEVISAGEKLTEKELFFSSEKPFVFVCPVYGWRIPRVFNEFIRNNSFTGNKKAYFLVTCGDGIGNAGAYAKKVCLEKNMEFMGAYPLVMPENYIAMFTAPQEEEAERIIMRAELKIPGIAEYIQKEEPFPAETISAADRLKSGPVNAAFYAFCVSARGFWTKADCTGCGLCAELCPLNNIELKETRPVWGSHCTHCMACICGCPHKAIEYKKTSRGKARYYNRKQVQEQKR